MLKNELLRKAFEAVASKAEDTEMFQRLVKAGQKIIYNANIFPKLTAELKTSQDPLSDVARGIVGVLKIMADKARGTAPAVPLMQAGMALMIDALDFLEQAGLLKVDNAALDRATQEYIENLLPAMGLSEERIAKELAPVQQAMADPKQMAAYRASLGGAKK